VRRDSNAAFVAPFKINRSQVYADWTLEEFQKNLDTFHDEGLIAGPPAGPPVADAAPRPGTRTRRQELAAPYHQRAAALESRGWLRQALEQNEIGLTIDPGDADAKARRARLADRIEGEVAARTKQGRDVATSSPADARRHYLAALALDPRSEAPFDGLRALDGSRAFDPPRPDVPRPEPPRSLTHVVRAEDTATALADLDYGDRAQARVIERANSIQPGAPLPVGRTIKIPEIPGVPFLRPDR
jgi:nucleoid-associated protein YgaU